MCVSRGNEPSVSVSTVEGITVAGARAFWRWKDEAAAHERLRAAVMTIYSDPHLTWEQARIALAQALTTNHNESDAADTLRAERKEVVTRCPSCNARAVDQDRESLRDERDSLRLELDAEKFNHLRDNEHLLLARDVLQADNAALMAERDRLRAMLAELPEWDRDGDCVFGYMVHDCTASADHPVHSPDCERRKIAALLTPTPTPEAPRGKTPKNAALAALLTEWRDTASVWERQGAGATNQQPPTRARGDIQNWVNWLRKMADDVQAAMDTEAPRG